MFSRWFLLHFRRCGVRSQRVHLLLLLLLLRAAAAAAEKGEVKGESEVCVSEGEKGL